MPSEQELFAAAQVTQTLSSGLVVRQDFRTAARFVFFETGFDEWPYATHGGTLFLVLFGGKPFGLTCRHVFKDFDWHQLLVTDERHGKAVAGLRQIAYPDRPVDAAIDTDLLDVAVLRFSDEVDAEFFGDPAYIYDAKTVATSETGDRLLVSGTLKTSSTIEEQVIAPKFCLLDVIDDTPTSNDPTLRRCFGVFDKPQFSDVIGLSGSPVFNVTKNALCGMIVRGTMTAETCVLVYIDIFDISKLLASVHQRQTKTYYVKDVVEPRS